MSHFVVLVTGHGIDGQMAPFNEVDDEYTERVVQIEVERGKEKEKANEIIKLIKDGSHTSEVVKKYQSYIKNEDWAHLFEDWGGWKLYPKGWGYTYNPNAKWDWYEVGGRWKGFLPLKKNAMGKLAEQDVYGDGYKPIVKEIGHCDIATKEAIDWPKLTHPPYAYLHEGEWVSHGDMGWFGFSDDKMSEKEWSKKFKEFIKSLPDNTLLTTVDCHI